MSTPSHVTPDNPPTPNDSHAGDHAHISPLRNYLLVWGALMVLTVVTVAVSRLDLGTANVPLALAIATLKASLVALFFMHLYYDERFNAVVFVSGIFFLSIFGGITIIDPLTRGAVDPVVEGSDFGPSMSRTSQNYDPLKKDDNQTSATQASSPEPAVGSLGPPSRRTRIDPPTH